MERLSERTYVRHKYLCRFFFNLYQSLRTNENMGDHLFSNGMYNYIYVERMTGNVRDFRYLPQRTAWLPLPEIDFRFSIFQRHNQFRSTVSEEQTVKYTRIYNQKTFSGIILYRFFFVHDNEIIIGFSLVMCARNFNQ